MGRRFVFVAGQTRVKTTSYLGGQNVVVRFSESEVFLLCNLTQSSVSACGLISQPLNPISSSNCWFSQVVIKYSRRIVFCWTVLMGSLKLVSDQLSAGPLESGAMRFLTQKPVKIKVHALHKNFYLPMCTRKQVSVCCQHALFGDTGFGFITFGFSFQHQDDEY